MLCETHFADFADVRLGPGVLPLVDLERVLLVESSFALVALERPVARVNSLVAQNLTLFLESLGAKLALVQKCSSIGCP